jgi:hypothetical protein
LVSSFYNQNFVSYRINTKNSLSLEEKNLIEESELHFNSVPFFLFFDNNSRKLMHYSGVKIEVENILEIGRTALNPKKRTASLKTKYANGDRSVRTLYAYANYLNVLNKENEIIKVTQELFNSFKKEELPTQKSYTILKNVIIDTDNGFFQYWINHLELLKDFETGNKKGTENQALEKIVLKALSSPDRKLWPDSKKENFSIWIKALEITDNPEFFWTD